jgi:hypothetical protein
MKYPPDPIPENPSATFVFNREPEQAKVEGKRDQHLNHNPIPAPSEPDLSQPDQRSLPGLPPVGTLLRRPDDDAVDALLYAQYQEREAERAANKVQEAYRNGFTDALILLDHELAQLRERMLEKIQEAIDAKDY